MVVIIVIVMIRVIIMTIIIILTVSERDNEREKEEPKVAGLERCFSRCFPLCSGGRYDESCVDGGKGALFRNIVIIYFKKASRGAKEKIRKLRNKLNIRVFSSVF